MATQTKNDTNDTIETATEKGAEFTDKAPQNSRKAGAAYLDSYEKAVVQFADGYEKAATATRIEWLSTVAATQADFAREVTKAYTSAARGPVARGPQPRRTPPPPATARAAAPQKGRRGSFLSGHERFV